MEGRGKLELVRAIAGEISYAGDRYAYIYPLRHEIGFEREALSPLRGSAFRSKSEPESGYVQRTCRNEKNGDLNTISSGQVVVERRLIEESTSLLSHL